MTSGVSFSALISSSAVFSSEEKRAMLRPLPAVSSGKLFSAEAPTLLASDAAFAAELCFAEALITELAALESRSSTMT